MGIMQGPRGQRGALLNVPVPPGQTTLLLLLLLLAAPGALLLLLLLFTMQLFWVMNVFCAVSAHQHAGQDQP